MSSLCFLQVGQTSLRPLEAGLSVLEETQGSLEETQSGLIGGDAVRAQGLV